MLTRDPPHHNAVTRQAGREPHRLSKSVNSADNELAVHVLVLVIGGFLAFVGLLNRLHQRAWDAGRVQWLLDLSAFWGVVGTDGRYRYR